MASKQNIALAEDRIQKFEAIDFKAIYRVSLGKISLKELKPTLNELSKRINGVDAIKEKLPNSVLKPFNEFLQALNQRLESIVRYNDSDYLSRRDTNKDFIIEKLESSTEWWSLTELMLDRESDNDDSKDVEKLKSTISKLQKEITKANKESQNIKLNLQKEYERSKEELNSNLNSLQSKLKLIDERYKEPLAKAEIDRQEGVFREEATSNKHMSWLWLTILIIYGFIMTGIFILLIQNFCFELKCFDKVECLKYNTVCKDCGQYVLFFEIFKSAMYRLLLISVMLYIFAFLLKNYNAQMHNRTINLQRANSLDAALILLESAKTEEGKDQIIMQAANSIFSHQKTGFLRKEGEPQNPNLISKLIEKVPGL